MIGGGRFGFEVTAIALIWIIDSVWVPLKIIGFLLLNGIFAMLTDCSRNCFGSVVVLNDQFPELANAFLRFFVRFGIVVFLSPI